MKDMSLIIPAYNEETRIKDAIESYDGELKKHYKDYEILVIINGSSDNTKNVVKNFKKDIPNLDYRDYPEKLGKGGAIIEGFKYSKGRILGFLDADDSFDVREIMKMVKRMDGIDCVIASKWKGRSFWKVNEPFSRKILSRGWNILCRVLLGLNFDDAQAGAKFFKRKVWDSVDHDFIGKGFEFDAEFLFKIENMGFNIKEYYIPSRHIDNSTFNFKYIPSMFMNIVRLFFSRFMRVKAE